MSRNLLLNWANFCGRLIDTIESWFQDRCVLSIYFSEINLIYWQSWSIAINRASFWVIIHMSSLLSSSTHFIVFVNGYFLFPFLLKILFIWIICIFLSISNWTVTALSLSYWTSPHSCLGSIIATRVLFRSLNIFLIIIFWV